MGDGALCVKRGVRGRVCVCVTQWCVCDDGRAGGGGTHLRQGVQSLGDPSCAHLVRVEGLEEVL